MKNEKFKSMKMPAGLDASGAVDEALEPEAGGGGSQGEDGNGLNAVSDEELLAELKARGLDSSSKPAPLKNMNSAMDEKSKKVSAK